MAEAPVPVQLALEALKILAAEDAALAEESRRKLPGFALRLAATGEEVTVERLLVSARAKEIDKPEAPKPVQKTYAEIMAGFPQDETEPAKPALQTDLSSIRKAVEGKNLSAEEALRLAARDGQLDSIKYLVEECGAGLEYLGFYSTQAVEYAAGAGYLDIVRYLVEKRSVPAERALIAAATATQYDFDFLKQLVEEYGADLPDWREGSMETVVFKGRLEILKYIVEECGLDFRANMEMAARALRNAAAGGQLDVLKYLVEKCGVDVQGDDSVLDDAAREGHLDIVKYLVEECGMDPHAHDEKVLATAQWACELDVLKYLIEECDADKSRLRHDAMEHALIFQKFPVARYLEEKCGQRLFTAEKYYVDRYNQYIAGSERWQQIAHMEPPKGLFDQDPLFYRAAPYKAVLAMVEAENYTGVHQMVFGAAGLFGTEDRVLQYLEKWGGTGRQPLHDIIQMIKLPEKKTPEMDLKAWGDAVLKCGPSMASLVKFADRVPVPEKSDDGKTWSMRKTREKVAEFVYLKARENPQLAALCMEHNVDEKDFNKALEISRNAPDIKNIPDITIAGENFDMPGATFHRLAANDIRGLFLGEMTDCCQSIGGAGSSCAKHGFTSEDSGFYVVENAKGRVVGQTWAWRGKEGELVFDSLETLGENVTGGQWLKLTEKFAEALAHKPGKITALHIGAGGATPKNLLRAFNEPASPAKPLGYGDRYRDSHEQVVIWQKKAGLKNG